jgi:hypothetical protein
MDKNLPSIVSLNETKLVSKLNLKNHISIPKNYKSNSGGLLIFLHNSYQYEKIEELNEYIFNPNTIEILAIKVLLDNTYLNFVNVYMRSDKDFFPSEFITLLGKYKNLILAGDFNCKSPIWFSSKYNSNRHKLEAMLDENDLNVIKYDKGTRFDKATNTYEVLDLFIVSSNLET